jgi:hypothetical protein
VVVVHGEADTGGRNKQKTAHDPVATWKADHCWCLAIQVSRMEISATGRDISAKWHREVFSLFFFAENPELEIQSAAQLVHSFQFRVNYI